MPLRPINAAKPLAIAILTSLIVASVAFGATSAPTTADMTNFSSTLDKDKNMHLEVTADMTAPVDKVFDALSHPELVAKKDAQIHGTKVISEDASGKIVEITGQTAPIPNAPKSIKIKVIPDKAANTIKVESVDSPILHFQTEYKLSPSKDGKGTTIKYSSVTNDVSKQIGMDVPEGMRKQIGIQTFMGQMNHVGEYIDDTSKVASSKHK